MIHVKKTERTINNELIRIGAKYSLNNIEGVLWFETKSENESFISFENCDSFFIIFFLMAMENKMDVTFESPVSRRLLFGIENYLMEALLIMKPEYKRINIFCEVSDYSNNEVSGVATAMSCGVDSFYTLYANKDGYQPVTHLTLFNAGAFGNSGGHETRGMFQTMINNATKVADELKLPFIWLDSNLNEVLNLPFVPTHTFRNLACALMFQNLFKTYYYSSGHAIEDFKLNPSDTANYDLINSISLTTNALEFFIVGMMRRRIQKTEALSNYPVTYKSLNVCLVTSDYDKVNISNSEALNCSKCFKCIRTMVSLDVIGKLQLYGDVFDLNIYKENKAKYIAQIIYHYYRSKNVFSSEIIKEMKKQNYKIPISVYVFFVLRAFQPIRDFFSRIFSQIKN